MDKSEKPKVQIVQPGKRASNESGGKLHESLMKISSESEIPENCGYRHETNSSTDPSDNDDSAALLIERATNCLQAMDLLGSMMSKECYNLSKGSNANNSKNAPSERSATMNRTFENINYKSSEQLQIQNLRNNPRDSVQISHENKSKTRRIPVQADSYYEKFKQSLPAESNPKSGRYTTPSKTTDSGGGSYSRHSPSESRYPSTGKPSISEGSKARHEVPSIGAMIRSAKIRERKISISATLEGDVGRISPDSDVTPPTEPITTAREVDDVDDSMTKLLTNSEFDPEADNFPDDKNYDEDGSTETNEETESPERNCKQTENGQPSGAPPMDHLTTEKLASLCLSQSEPRSWDFKYNKGYSELSSSRANPFTRTHSDPLSTSAPYLHRESKLTYDNSSSFPSVENVENFENRSLNQLSDVNSMFFEFRTIGNQDIDTDPSVQTDDTFSTANRVRFSISCVSSVTTEQKPKETIFCETVQSNSFSTFREAKQVINHVNQSDFKIISDCENTKSAETTEFAPSHRNEQKMDSDQENSRLAKSLSDNEDERLFDETQCQMSHKTVSNGSEVPTLSDSISRLGANLGSDSTENDQNRDQIYNENILNNQISSKSKIKNQNIDEFNSESSSLEGNSKFNKLVDKSNSTNFASRNNDEFAVIENGTESVSRIANKGDPFLGAQNVDLKSTSCSSVECTHLSENTDRNSVTITSENFHYPAQVSTYFNGKPSEVKRNQINITDTEVASPANDYFDGIVSVQSSEISSVTQKSDFIPSGSIQSVTCTLSCDQDRWTNDNQSASVRISQPIITSLGSVFDLRSKHQSQCQNIDVSKNSDNDDAEHYDDDTASIWLQNSNCDNKDIDSDKLPLLEPFEGQKAEFVADSSHVTDVNDVDSFWVIDGVIQTQNADFSRGDDSRKGQQLESNTQEDSKSDDAATRTLLTDNSVDSAPDQKMCPDGNREWGQSSKSSVLAPISVPLFTERGFWIVFKESVIY